MSSDWTPTQPREIRPSGRPEQWVRWPAGHCVAEPAGGDGLEVRFEQQRHQTLKHAPEPGIHPVSGQVQSRVTLAGAKPRTVSAIKDCPAMVYSRNDAGTRREKCYLAPGILNQDRFRSVAVEPRVFRSFLCRALSSDATNGCSSVVFSGFQKITA